MSRLFVLVCLSMMVIFNINCQKSENPVNSMNSTPAGLHQADDLNKVHENDLYMPDSVPNVVNVRALELCCQYEYSNIRILAVDKNKKPVYHILYFDNDLTENKAFLFELDNEETTIISEEEVSLPNDGSKLQKPMDDYKCWKLATVYDGTWYSGSSFQFSQATTTYGWFHKVIDCLATTYTCCNGTYNANFNNIISSSYWEDDYYSPEGRIARAIALSAWVDCGRMGNKVVFGDESWRKDTRFDPDATKGTVCHQTLLAPNWGAAGFDNTISALDMFYRVYTPTSCN